MLAVRVLRRPVGDGRAAAQVLLEALVEDFTAAPPAAPLAFRLADFEQVD